MSILVSQDTMLHPPHRDEIIQALEESIADAIFGNSVCPRIVPHRYLGYGKAMHECQGRKESVHTGEQLEFIDDSPPENLQRTSGIVDPVPGYRTPDRVGDTRRQFPHEIVVARDAPAADKIVALCQRKQGVNIRGIVLKVAVHRDHECARRMFESGIEG